MRDAGEDLLRPAGGDDTGIGNDQRVAAAEVASILPGQL